MLAGSSGLRRRSLFVKGKLSQPVPMRDLGCEKCEGVIGPDDQCALEEVLHGIWT